MQRRDVSGGVGGRGEKEQPEKVSLQIEILTDTRPPPHNRTQAAPHSVRPYFVAAVARASG